mmetsp:Transcript_110905/g.192283  ORF Transcript_110905/g.192283 Transcript_110905/m.192283 type:complete len:203 (-) Transcript_110905:208-816(-)
MPMVVDQRADLVEHLRGNTGLAEGMNFKNSTSDLRSKLRSKGDVILTEIGLQPPKKKKQAAANGKSGKAQKAPGSTPTKAQGGRATPKATMEPQAPLTPTSPMSPSLGRPLTEWDLSALVHVQKDEPGNYVREFQEGAQKPAFALYPMKVGIEIEKQAPLKVKSAFEDQQEFTFDSYSGKYDLQASIQELLQASLARTAMVA